jgi:hypothetical protein
MLLAFFSYWPEFGAGLIAIARGCAALRVSVHARTDSIFPLLKSLIERSLSFSRLPHWLGAIVSCQWHCSSNRISLECLRQQNK